MDAQTLSKRYLGSAAAEYFAKRSATKVWQQEQAIVDDFLKQFSAGTRCLDVPVGTGRFLGDYQRHGFSVVGVDASPDMLALALETARQLGLVATLRLGNVFSLDAPAETFDVVVCMRFLNWVPTAKLTEVLREIARVSSGSLIVGIVDYPPAGSLFAERRGVMRAVRQLLHRLHRHHAGRTFTHGRREVLRAFQSLGLLVSEARTVQIAGNGTDYKIYWLRKITPSGDRERTI